MNAVLSPTHHGLGVVESKDTDSSGELEQPDSHPLSALHYAITLLPVCRLSAGIACNRALAKLVSGLHKPDDQTVLTPLEATRFLAPLPV